MDSCPSHDAGGRFFFEFEPVRAASSDRGSSCVDAVVAMPRRVDGVVTITRESTRRVTASVPRRDIADYVSRVKQAHRDFRDAQHGPFTWPSDRIKDAYDSMDKTYSKMKILEAEAEAFRNLQELFELNKIKAPELLTLRTELKLLKQVWDCVGVVESLFGSWSDTLWLDIRPDDLVDECKKLATHVKRLPRRLRDWPCYLRLQGSVQNMASILPLVSELRSPCMRDRHWKAVASECHKPVEKGPGFCLADLLKLQLHEHVEGIMEIVQISVLLGVCGGFTPSTHVLSIREGAGWFYFRFWGLSDRDGIAVARLGPNGPRIEKETSHDLL